MGRVGVPDGLVGDHDLGPVLDLVRNGLELGSHDIDSLVRLALLQALTAAENDAQTAINRCLGLARDELCQHAVSKHPLPLLYPEPSTYPIVLL